MSVLFSCGPSRDEILKVYNRYYYIDESLIEDFEKWYKKQTGRDVTIVYHTFDSDETMFAAIELEHKDYDVVCPADYIIERMLMKDLLLPINMDFAATPDYIKNISPYITDCLSNIAANSSRNANDYVVGYMWGTVGLIYNPAYVSAEEVKHWDVLKNPAYADRILVKKNLRDVYSALLVALNHDAIVSGEKDLSTITSDVSDEAIKMVEDYIMSFKKSIVGWDSGNGTQKIMSGRTWINLSWNGEAERVIEQAKEKGVELAFSVPEDGSSVWFDGWVIPRYAKNTEAARYFINFLCKPKNAILNMDRTGCTSAVAGDVVLKEKINEEEYEAVDVSYFFGDAADSVCINAVRYPDKTIMARCAIKHDSEPDRTEALMKMWSRVKGNDNIDIFYFIILAIVLVVMTLAFISKLKKSRSII